MAYTKENFPPSMKNLISEIREKAIEILNKLVDEKEMELNMAIPTAISRAKDWAANRNIDVPESNTDAKKHGEDVYVTPHTDGWAIKKEKSERARALFKNKIEAVSNARDLAKRNHANLIVQRKNGTIQSKISYNK